VVEVQSALLFLAEHVTPRQTIQLDEQMGRRVEEDLEERGRHVLEERKREKKEEEEKERERENGQPHLWMRRLGMPAERKAERKAGRMCSVSRVERAERTEWMSRQAWVQCTQSYAESEM
jgi:hypothetical protein